MNPTHPRIVEFETIDSTNSEAHRRAAAGERGPLWIRSDAQQTGRGRSGRPWSSPPGNLSATFLFSPTCPRPSFHQLSFVAGLAGYDAIAPHLTDTSALQLKWPNDLLIANAKVGGILIESSSYGRDTVVIIGVGLNIVVTPDIKDRAVTQIDRHGQAPPAAAVLLELNAALLHWLQTWNNGANFDLIRQSWLQRAHKIGQPLAVNTNEQALEGTFQGLADNGALLLALPSGEIRRIEHGDVSLASPAPDLETRA